MHRVWDVMLGAPATASVDESVRRAGARMETLRTNCLPVLDTDGDLVGLLTVWDVHRANPNRLVVDAMSTNVVPVSGNTSIWQAYRLADHHAVEYLPVMDDGRLAGLVTRFDLSVAVARLTDALTGLPTASYLRFRVEAMFQSERDISLLFLDINDFGMLNKRLGHAAGDRALQMLARILVTEIDQERDALCRYGGDEFAIVTNRTASEAQELAASVLQQVDSAPWPDGASLRVSVGIAGGRRRKLRQADPTVVDNLINIASRASTEAKRDRTGLLVVDVPAGA